MTLSAAQVPQMAQPTTITTFLSTMLMVLAFFILLVSLTVPDADKADAVIKSIKDSFAPDAPPGLADLAFSGLRGERIGLETLKDEIPRVFATLLRVAQVDISPNGQRMSVTLPIGKVFREDSVRLIPGRYALLDRIITTLGNQPTGIHFDLKILINAPEAASEGEADDGLAFERAATLSEELVSRGMPPHSLAVGVVSGTGGHVVFEFHRGSADHAAFWCPDGTCPTNADLGPYLATAIPRGLLHDTL